jgi:hypothetical protein
MISGLVLKYLNGECFVIRRGYETTLPVSTSFCLTVPMAATIMGGLAFASLLTMVAAPVLYYVFFKRSKGPVDNSAKMVA